MLFCNLPVYQMLHERGSSFACCLQGAFARVLRARSRYDRRLVLWYSDRVAQANFQKQKNFHASLNLLGEYALKMLDKRKIQAANHVLLDQPFRMNHRQLLVAVFFIHVERVPEHLMSWQVHNRANRVMTERRMLLKMDHPGIATCSRGEPHHVQRVLGESFAVKAARLPLCAEM